jgi:hypothetical protein
VPAVPDEAVERGGLDRTLLRREVVDGRVREPYPLTAAGRRARGINQVSKTIKPNGPAVLHPYQPASNPAEERVRGMRGQVAERARCQAGLSRKWVSNRSCSPSSTSAGSLPSRRRTMLAADISRQRGQPAGRSAAGR